MNELSRTAFTIQNRHGDTIQGNVHRTPGGEHAPVLVICHGFKGFKDWAMFPWIASQAVRCGWNAVRFNFSLSGISDDLGNEADPEKFRRNTYTRELEDLDDVLQALFDGCILGGIRPRRVALFGHSRGGGIAILKTARSHRIDALVTWAAVANLERWGPETRQIWLRDGKLDVTNSRTKQVLPLGVELLHDVEQHRDALDIRAAAAAVRVPWLIVHGEQDLTVPLDEARLLHAASAERAKLEIIPHGDHSFGATHPFPGPTPQLTHAMNATMEWMKSIDN